MEQVGKFVSRLFDVTKYDLKPFYAALCYIATVWATVMSLS